MLASLLCCIFSTAIDVVWILCVTSPAMVQKKALRSDSSQKVRRKKVPDVDQEHLNYHVEKYARECRAGTVFQMQAYNSLSKSQAIDAHALVELLPLCRALVAVSPTAFIRYTQLRAAIMYVVRKHPWAAHQLTTDKPVGDLDGVVSQVADNCLTLLKHLRRLKRPDRFRQAVAKLPQWGAALLRNFCEELQDSGEDSDDECAPLPVQSAPVDTDLELPSTQDIEDMVDDLPSPSPLKGRSQKSQIASRLSPEQDRKAAVSAARLLDEAMAASPIAPKKADVYQQMAEQERVESEASGRAKQQIMKRPAARPKAKTVAKKQKRTAGKPSPETVFEAGSLKLMTYPTGAVAVRMKFAPQSQLFQIKMKTTAEAWNAAEKLKNELESGKVTLGTVLAKKKALQK